MDLDINKKDEYFIKLKRTLQKHQAERLEFTYKDIWEQSEFNALGKFFFEKLYAPNDFSFRDNGIKKLFKMLKGILHKKIISAIGMVIELHELSDRLDEEMVVKMIEHEYSAEKITTKDYKKIYRSMDNYDERIYQMKLGVNSAKAVYSMSKAWLIGAALATVRGTSHLIGMGKIMDFLHEGYHAFRRINNIHIVLDAISERELEFHNKMWY